MRSLSLRPIPVLLALASLTLVACDEATDPTVTGPRNSLSSAAAPIPITTCGTVITQPGVYEMAVNFGGIIGGDYCSGPIIDIRVSNVTIRGNHHGVDGAGGPCILAGVGVPGGLSQIRLVGLDLRMCHSGAIVFENVSSSVVANSTIWFNGGGGIVINGSPALSRADTVRNSSFSDNSSGGGVTITSGGDFSDFVISDNLFDNSNATSSCGVTLSVSHSVIRRNTITGEGRCGFEVTGNRNTIISNIVAVSDVGISVGGRRNVIGENRVRAGVSGIREVMFVNELNTLRGNTVEGGDIAIEARGHLDVIQRNTVQNAGYGIAVIASRTRVTGNKVLNNSKAGIRVSGVPNVIAENTALNNLGFDLQDDLPCGANTWRGNTFGTASAACIQ